MLVKYRQKSPFLYENFAEKSAGRAVLGFEFRVLSFEL